MDIRILYEDKFIIICVKSAGIATQTKKLAEKDMVSLLSSYRTDKGEESSVYVVHRLDQGTEGIMVFAKDSRSAAILSKQIQDGVFKKCYMALVEKSDLKSMDTFVDYMISDKKTNLSKVVPKETKDAKKAVLSYKIIDSRANSDLVDIELLTGRHHQIRCQFAHHGAPLLGDKKYGAKGDVKKFALCAYKLSFMHPQTNKEMSYEIKPEGFSFLEN